MSYNKIPNHWTEKDCNNAIHDLIAEGSVLASSRKYDKAATKFLMVAQILKSLPEFTKRLVRKDKVKKYIDDRNKYLEKKELEDKKLKDDIKKDLEDKKNTPTVR